MNNDLGKALLFILFLNVLFFLGQFSVATYDSEVSFFNYQDTNVSMMGQFDKGGYQLNEDVSGEIPQGTNTIDTETNNFFTDTWKTLRGWILKIPGANYIYNIVNAVPHFLSMMGVPVEIVFAIGFLWHALTIFLIVNWIKGG